MKEIKAYIRKEKADIVIRKLQEAGVTGMTVLDANALAEWPEKKHSAIPLNTFKNILLL